MTMCFTESTNPYVSSNTKRISTSHDTIQLNHVFGSLEIRKQTLRYVQEMHDCFLIMYLKLYTEVFYFEKLHLMFPKVSLLVKCPFQVEVMTSCDVSERSRQRTGPVLVSFFPVKNGRGTAGKSRGRL